MPTHVMTFMRANPPTAGHETVVNKVLDVAKKTGGSHSVILSHSQDPKKNPLPPSQKLKHAKKAFPNANVEVASDEMPTLLHHAVRYHQQGVKNLHVVVGQDRVQQFKDLLDKYNGVEKPHGYYKFNNITVHSAGNRDPDAEGLEGISGTKMRQAANSGDRETFHAGASSAMSEKQKDDMMKDIVKNSKKVNEEVVGSVDARGLGFVTGVPAVQGSEIANYVEKNTADSDQKDNILKTFKKFHTDHHTKIFKSFLDKK